MVKWLTIEHLFPKSSLSSMENRKLQGITKFYRPENCANVVATKIDSEI